MQWVEIQQVDGVANSVRKVIHGHVLQQFAASNYRLSETQYESGSVLPSHDHDSPYISMALSGSYREYSQRFECAVAAPCVIYHPAATYHANTFGPVGVRCFNLVIDPAWLQRLDMESSLGRSPSVHPNGKICWLVSRLRAEMITRDSFSELAIEALVLEILIEVGRVRYSKQDGNLPGWLRRAKELVDHDFRQNLTLQRIAAVAAVHPVHLARAFHRHVGCTVGEYVRRKRIVAACEMLRTGGIQIAAIAVELGFSDQSSFTKCFKRHIGATPGAYRDRCLDAKPGPN